MDLNLSSEPDPAKMSPKAAHKSDGVLVRTILLTLCNKINNYHMAQVVECVHS
jgi:hypothetical protein